MENQNSVKEIVARNVKKYRKLNNMTQAELAELADISNTYIANIECGQTWISDKTLEKIAAALNTEIYLLFLPESDKNQDSAEKHQNKIAYLNQREKELEAYIKDYFSETFSELMNR